MEAEEAFINGHHKTKFDDENDNGEYFNKIYFKLKLIHFECGCGARVLTCNKSKHLKSPKHLNFINKIPVKPKAESIIDCGCGKTFSLKNKSHHNKTQYHLDWIKCNEISI